PSVIDKPKAGTFGDAMPDALIDPVQVRFVQIVTEKTAACSSRSRCIQRNGWVGCFERECPAREAELPAGHPIAA
ncbi:MAG: hypothetical protein AAAC47_20070, partial [Pararhizobium sp.]